MRVALCSDTDVIIYNCKLFTRAIYKRCRGFIVRIAHRVSFASDLITDPALVAGHRQPVRERSVNQIKYPSAEYLEIARRVDDENHRTSVPVVLCRFETGEGEYAIHICTRN